MPICRSRALLLRGRLAALCGDVRRARRHWRNGLAEATRSGQPLEEALLLLALGKAGRGAQDGPEHVREAAAILASLGARPWLYAAELPDPGARPAPIADSIVDERPWSVT